MHGTHASLSRFYGLRRVQQLPWAQSGVQQHCGIEIVWLNWTADRGGLVEIRDCRNPTLQRERDHRTGEGRGRIAQIGAEADDARVFRHVTRC